MCLGIKIGSFYNFNLVFTCERNRRTKSVGLILTNQNQSTLHNIGLRFQCPSNCTRPPSQLSYCHIFGGKKGSSIPGSKHFAGLFEVEVEGRQRGGLGLGWMVY